MTQFVRIVGFLLVVVGALILASYLIEPLRAVWPWLLQLPLPVRIGLGLAAVGLVLVAGSVIHERLQALPEEKGLLED